MKRKVILILSLLCVMLMGCSKIGGIKYKNIITEENTDTYSIYIEMPKIDGIENKEFSVETTNLIENRISEWTSDFKERLPEKLNTKAELSVSSDLMFNKNDFISIETVKKVYLGGAHGNMWKYCENIDIKYSKILELKDLFIDDKYPEFINRRMQELITDKPKIYFDLWQKPVLSERHQTDFYIHDGNLIIYYQPYDLSYYAKGFVEFPISIESLRGYIKPEYAERFF